MIGKHFEHIFILNKQNMPPIIFKPVASGGSRGSDETPLENKLALLKSTFCLKTLTIKVLIGVKLDENL